MALKRGSNPMTVNRKHCDKDMTRSLRKGSALGNKIEAVSRLGRKLTGHLRSNVLRESE